MLFLISVFSFAGNQVKQESIIGDLIKIKSEQKLKGVPFTYYLFFSKDKKSYGFPVKFINKSLEKKAVSLENTTVKVRAIMREKEFLVIESKRRISYLEADEISPMPLSLLAQKNNNEKYVATEKIQNNRDVDRTEGINIPDKVANSIIFAGGAALIGTIIKDVLKRRGK